MNLDCVKVIQKEEDEEKNFKDFLSQIPQHKLISQFKDEQVVGEWAINFQKFISANKSISDCTDHFKQVTLKKTALEISSLRISSKFTEYCMKQLTEHIEHLIDQDDMRLVSKISSKIEALLDSDLTSFKSKLQHTQVDTQLLEFAYSPSIQANSHFDLQVGAQGQGKLTADTVIISIGGKYQDMCTSVSRVLLIGPTERQKQSYLFIHDVFEQIQRELRADRLLSEVYKSVIQKFKDHELCKYLPKNFGYGIGMTIKEDMLCIKQDNNRKVETGMCFNIRVSLTDFNQEQVPKSQNCVLISDTLLVLEQGAEVLTRGVSRSYPDISYFLDDDEEETAAPEKNENKTIEINTKKPIKKESVVLEGRTREVNQKKQNSDIMTREQARSKHQEELFNSKFEDLKARWEEDKVKLGQQLGLKTFDLTKVNAYPDAKQCKGLENKLYFDKQASALVCPVKFPSGGSKYDYVPFHIRIIKNCSLQADKTFQILRINFHTPTQAAKDIVLPSAFEKNIYIKELTFKSGDGGKNLIQVHGELREALRILKQQDLMTHKSADAKEEDNHLAQEPLTVMKQPSTLKDLILRPAITGKKTIGELQTHCNGFRFMSQKGQKIDITYSNINHAFFQPCEDIDIIVLIHFRLKAPILIGNKKYLDVQMYTEVCNQFEDINERSNRRRMTEADEIAEEKRELEQRKRLDQKFKIYCNQSEQIAQKYGVDLTFDIPFKELIFSGCHNKACVNMFPTSTSLVSLQEPPFFVSSMKDIELVHFERVSLAVKNFDFVLVYKDYANFKRISSVPMESLCLIKDWLDESDIIYTEGPISLNWATILQQIRSDIGGFIEQDGWSFLCPNGANDDASESVNSDSNFDEDEAGSDDEESDYSGSEKDESDDGGDSSEVKTNSDDSEGTDWDEMEKQTIQNEKEQLVQNLKAGQQQSRAKQQVLQAQQQRNQVKSLKPVQKAANFGASKFSGQKRR